MKRKTAVVVLLLIAATVLMIGVPLGLGVRFPDTAVTSWHYTDAEQYVLTEQQMARIYYARVSTFFLGESISRQVSRETVCTLIEKVVQAADDRQVLEQVVRDGEEDHCNAYEEIVAVDGRPVAVRYIWLAYETEKGSVTMVFEEKTGTVLMIHCSGTVASETQDAIKTVSSYYEGVLGLTADQYNTDAMSTETGVERWEVSIAHARDEEVLIRAEDEKDTE